MRICLVTGIFPPDIGGPATYVSNLAEYLHANGNHVEVITYSDSLEPSTLPFLVHKVKRSSSSIRKFIHTRRFVKAVSKRSDLVYINGLLFPAASAMRAEKIPCVAKIVGDTVWERAQNKGLIELTFDEFQSAIKRGRVKLWQSVRDRSLAGMDRIIVPSEFLRGVVSRWGFGEKVEVIYNGVPSDYGSEYADVSSEEAKKSLGLDGWIVLSVGRLCRWKGFRTIIRTLSLLGKETKLVIAGEGPYMNELVKTANAHGVADRVDLVGRIEHNRLPLYFRAADCFVLNSGYEGFPHIVLEAMLMKCPVIAASCCGTPELINDHVNGILTEKDNEQQIVDAVRSIQNDSTLRDTIIEGGLEVAKHFSWDMTIGETVKLLESMV